MALENGSLKSLDFGDEYKPEDLSYDELGEKCQYLILREADPIKFKTNPRPGNRGTLNSLKDLEKEKRKLMRALEKNHEASEHIEIQLIDLTLDSDEENTTVALPTQNQTSSIRMPKIQKVEKIQSPDKQRSQKETSNSPLRKKIRKRCDVSDFLEKVSDAKERCCKYCKHCQRKKPKMVKKYEYETDSSDLYTSYRMRKRRERAKIKEDAERKLKRTSESPTKCLYGNSSLKAFHDVEEVFGDFRCRVCNVEVHSEVTLQTHLVGRKHLKNLMAQTIPEVARQSLEQFSSKPSSSTSYDYDGNELLHYNPTSPGSTFVRVNKISKLQTVAESYRKHPVIGLTYVTEVRLLREIIYYCELCDSSCAPNSIMCHLIGFKHKINFFRLKYPKMYERFEYQPKRVIQNEMKKILLDYDKTHGRGLINVEEEVNERRVRKRRRSYSPQRLNCRCSSCCAEVQNYGSKYKSRNKPDSLITEDLDMSMNDFRCTVCDSHMNTEQMWEAHVRGKRHLKNKMKGPSEKISKVKNIHCPGERPKLMNELLDIREPIVGLNYIHEIQGRTGNQYKCFLCGACCTSFDIIDHIVSEKHRTKLLEAEHKRGKHNAIETILNLSLGLSLNSREKLVEQEAAKFQREHGKGKMAVYKTKDIFP